MVEPPDPGPARISEPELPMIVSAALAVIVELAANVMTSVPETDPITVSIPLTVIVDPVLPITVAIFEPPGPPTSVSMRPMAKIPLPAVLRSANVSTSFPEPPIIVSTPLATRVDPALSS
jgi:hypothetical protein